MSTRRDFLKSAALAGAAAYPLFAAETKPLEEFRYSEVELAPGLAQTQFEQTQSILLGLNEDSLLKPWRIRAGLPAPGPDLGGWYDELPLDKTESGGHGFAPAHSFGQWLSALARGYATTRDDRTRVKLLRLLALYEPAISGSFYKNFRFPAYNYDKLVIGLIDAHQFADVPKAFALLDKTTDAADPHLPPTALDRDEPQKRWRASVGDSTENDYTWDESYTGAENLFLAAQRGAGERYRKMAPRFLLDQTYFDPLSENRNVLGNHHAYSFCNALSSAMQAYLSMGSEKHLRAASNAFDMITNTQSFATGGWGPNESFSDPASDALYQSLSETHRGFETPCGAYAHFKLTRYLLRVTRDGRYGDSMERVFYNTVLGAKPLQSDGRAFYYSDYNREGQRTYFPDAWPCCSGTLPQVTADYRLLPYFREPGSLYVNMYLPSTAKFTTADGALVALRQETAYPQDDQIKMVLRTSRPTNLRVRLRIPAWTQGATLAVNGAAVVVKPELGFASISRKWKDGDRIELRLPLTVRLEPIDKRHLDTVALVRGPLVLFATGKIPEDITRAQLIAAANTKESTLALRSFTELGDVPYRTYLNVV